MYWLALSLMVGLVAGQCPQMSWQTIVSGTLWLPAKTDFSRAPYATAPKQEAYLVTDTIQQGCSSYFVNETVFWVEPCCDEEPGDSYTLDVAYSITSATWIEISEVNPDHDALVRRTRWYWGMDQETLISDVIYQRFFWPYEECGPPVQTATFSTTTQTTRITSATEVTTTSYKISQYSNATAKTVEVDSVTTSVVSERLVEPNPITSISQMPDHERVKWLREHVVKGSQC